MDCFVSRHRTCLRMPVGTHVPQSLHTPHDTAPFSRQATAQSHTAARQHVHSQKLYACRVCPCSISPVRNPTNRNGNFRHLPTRPQYFSTTYANHSQKHSNLKALGGTGGHGIECMRKEAPPAKSPSITSQQHLSKLRCITCMAAPLVHQQSGK